MQFFENNLSSVLINCESKRLFQSIDRLEFFLSTYSKKNIFDAAMNGREEQIFDINCEEMNQNIDDFYEKEERIEKDLDSMILIQKT
jgi:hypothetical protein